ncbi:MAG TPA: helix-turn-helix domain-containing protein [Acidimicrobiales bacterium]|nr:helix-turn-helix domain-containing protein [Acidimicrobiales bacterium]
MPRPSRIGTREQILATALELFLAQGYEATSLRAIAEHLEITKAALYYHFPAKEQLVVELTRPFLNELADLVAKARAEDPQRRPDRRLVLLTAYLDALVTHRRVISLLAQNPATQNHPDVGLRLRNLIESYTTEIAGPDAREEDKVRVACAIGVINAVATGPITDPIRAKPIILGAALAALDSDPLAEHPAEPGRRAGRDSS